MKTVNHSFFIFLFILAIYTQTPAENLTITINANAFQILPGEKGFSAIEMEDFGAVSTAGKPQIPVKSFMIAIPPGARVSHVQITANHRTEIQGQYKIQPVKPMLQSSDDELTYTSADYQKSRQEWQENYDAVYSDNAPFPDQIGVYTNQGQWRKYYYARIKFYPFQYNPHSEKLIHYASCTVSIDYEMPVPGSKSWQESRKMLSDHVLDDMISKRIINFEEAQAWYQPTYQGKHLNAQNQYNYLIIVRDNTMRGAIVNFKNWKEKLGFGVKVVTLDSIFTHINGGDDPERIWNFLQQNYSGENWGIRYVLLIGDIDVLPMRFLCPNNNGWPYGSDFYYANLTQNWDVDNDNRWGEPNDDNLDATPDVLVGRIPSNSPMTVTSILNNYMSFEQNTGVWKRHALFSMGIMDYNSSGKTDCAVLGENQLKKTIFDPRGWTYTTQYEKDGISPSTFTSTQALSDNNFIGELGPQKNGVVNAVAHGSPGGMAGHVWFQDINSDGQCNYSKDANVNEATYTWFGRIDNIPANVQSVVFLCGCSTGPLINSDNTKLGSSLQILRTPMRSLGKTCILNGAPAVIASTAGSDYRQNWSKPQDGAAQSLNYYFFDELISKDLPAGDAFYNATVDFVDKHGWKRGVRVFNYYGDPSIGLKGIDYLPGGTDVVIHDSTNWGFAADYDSNGDMYTAVITTSNNDPGHIQIYKSTDHGGTWQKWNSITSRSPIFDVEVIVGKWGLGEFEDNRLLIFYSTSSGTQHVSRFPLVGGSAQNVLISSEGGQNAVFRITAARDPNPASFNVYFAYEVFDSNSGNVTTKAARSLNNGATWKDWDSFPGYSTPSIDAGVNRHVYLAVRGQNLPYHVHIFGSTDAGENWSTNTNVTQNFGAYSYGEPSVAASTDPGAPTVWVAYPVWNNTRYDIHYTFSKNGGTNWDDDYVLAQNTGLSNTVYMKGYNASPNQWMNIAFINTFAKPQVYWRYSAGTTPDAWSVPRIVNDFEAAAFTSQPPRLVYSPGAAGTGSGVVYAGTKKLYFTAPWLTSEMDFYNNQPLEKLNLKIIAEENTIRLNFELKSAQNVAAKIYSSLGEPVKTLNNAQLSAGEHTLHWDGRNNAGEIVQPGNYFCVVKTKNQSDHKGFYWKKKVGEQSNAGISDFNWMEIGNLDNAFTVSDLVVENQEIQYAAAVVSVDASLNEGCVFRTENGGESWNRLGELEACWSLNCLHQINEEVLLAGGLALTDEGPRGVIYRTENRGQSWDPVLWFPDGVVTNIIQTRDGHLYAATGWNGLIFKSDDAGNEWVPIAELGERIHIYSLMQDAQGDLFAGIVREGNEGQILFSEDNGGEWTAAGGLEGVTAVYDLLDAVDKMYAGVSGVDMGWVYQSTTRGRTWSTTAELTNTEVQAVHCLLEYVPENGDIPVLLVGTEMKRGPSYTEIYAKQQNQANWLAFGGSIDMASAVYTLAKTPHKILAGTGFIYGNIYTYDIEQKTGAGNQRNDLIPQTFDLAQNYPNPFNPKTEIAYQLPEESDIEINIYNLQGQKVTALVHKKQPAGYYKISWDGLNDKHQTITSGIYFYRMQAGEYVKVRRMILLK